MILYRLICHHGHQFDSWFRDSDGFDQQTQGGLVLCPDCGASRVKKAIMAPALVGTTGTQSEATIPERDEPSTNVALLDERQSELRALARTLREKILAETHDVGGRFPDEARRIHDGAVPKRQIRGQATLAEAQDLLEDGILIMPIPVVADELN